MTKKILPLEKDIQASIINWFKIQHSKHAFIHHSANENPKGLAKQQAIKYHVAMRKQGRKKGFPDLMVVCKGQSAFFEVKRGNAKVDEEQIKILEELRENGSKAMIVKSFDEAKVEIDEFIKNALKIHEFIKNALKGI